MKTEHTLIPNLALPDGEIQMSGFTGGIRNGTVTNFRQFALQCARAFGALLPDGPMSDRPEHREPSFHCAQRVADLKSELEKLGRIDATKCEQAAQEEFQKEMELFQELSERIAVRNGRYDRMLAKVELWAPPTEKHEALKKFMRDQLEFAKHPWTPKPPKRMTGAEWLIQRRSSVLYQLQAAEKDLASDIEHCRRENAWIDALYASLPQS